MKWKAFGAALPLAAAACLLFCSEVRTVGPDQAPATARGAQEKRIALPETAPDGAVSVERAIQQRRSVRHYTDAPITISELSQMLWAAQGITHKGRGLRAAPSAGALYPLEILVAAGRVTGLKPGLYRYVPAGHALETVAGGDVRADIVRAALRQTWAEKAPAIILVTAVYGRTTRKYGERGVRYVHMEVGHASQNLWLQAVALGLKGGIIGAFDDDALARVAKLGKDESPLCILTIGH